MLHEAHSILQLADELHQHNGLQPPDDDLQVYHEGHVCAEFPACFQPTSSCSATHDEDDLFPTCFKPKPHSPLPYDSIIEPITPHGQTRKKQMMQARSTKKQRLNNTDACVNPKLSVTTNAKPRAEISAKVGGKNLHICTLYLHSWGEGFKEAC